MYMEKKKKKQWLTYIEKDSITSVNDDKQKICFPGPKIQITVQTSMNKNIKYCICIYITTGWL